jgi:small subunit ribosomal protein S4
MQISGSRKMSFGNHTVFGRPTKERYRYRNSFYAKQQLRAFYGEVKETVFRNFYKKYLQSVTLRNKSFFSGLESRLDILFFRRRLLPTIFSCRQFIQHQGLEVNSIVEKSPRALIRTGDRISVPHNA